MTKSKIFLFLLVAFIGGVALRSFVFVPYAMLWIIITAAAAVFTIGISRRRRELWITGLFIAALFIGIFRYDAMERRRPDLSQWYGKAVMVEGVVWEAPVREQNVQRLKIRITAIDGNRLERPFFILATARRYPAYRAGDLLRIEGVIEQPENFGDFDYVSYLARDRIYASMSFPQTIKIGEEGSWRLAVILSRVKDAFEANLDAALPEPHAAFLKGLTLGERESLPAELVEDFQKTGTSHIVALSGYNITMIGRFITNSLIYLTAPFYLSFWMAAGAIILFVLLTGASASAVRAGIMGVLVLVAQREGREYRMTNALAFAGAAMIFHNPYLLRFDAAFQLSFLATAGIVYLAPRVGRWIDRIRSKLNFSQPEFILERDAAESEKHKLLPLRQTLVETLSAQMMVLPLLIYLFGRVSLISPVTNVLVLVAVPYAMTLGYIIGGLGFLWSFLAYIFGWVAWAVLEYMLRVIDIFASFPAASIALGRWALVILILVYCWIGWQIWKKSGAISTR